MNRLFFLAAVFFLPVVICAQVTVVDVTTDSVNVFNKDEKTIKSNKIAMAASLVFPGWGQQYMGKRNAAFIFAGLDLAALFGAVFCESYSRRVEKDAFGYAASYASIDGTGKNTVFWNNVGSFMSMDAYNQAADLNRQSDLKYTDPSYMWIWPDESMLKQYQKIRFNSRKFHTVASVCIGAMALNRIIAFVDIRASSKFKRDVDAVSFNVNPVFSPGFKSAGLTVSARF